MPYKINQLFDEYDDFFCHILMSCILNQNYGNTSLILIQHVII